jgi:hypothetical protein
VIYEAAYVGLSAEQRRARDEYERTLDPRSAHAPNYFARSSAWRAASLTSYDHTKEYFNAGAELRFTERQLSLDDYLREHPYDVEFLKRRATGSFLLRYARSDKKWLCGLG